MRITNDQTKECRRRSKVKERIDIEKKRISLFDDY